MFLKEIEIQGFKSFADKTKVVFDQGVTAVVGPNGSGKSNITESLRWALGESSVKSLRGGKMPDVIFAGTETRNPLNYASVVVVLDNKDRFIKQAGDEIRVERHIYRSGDSEYKIDGKKVRLRDIHELFLDTGLGRDSFSIISQGKVEEIFNSKAEERRAIFEEAAGVLKYKTRRKETESKLTQTQDNLDRLEDIIYELEGQLKPLEKQALTAKRFLELDEERKTLYLDVLVAQIRSNKNRLNQATEKLQMVQNDLVQYYAKREKLEEENQHLKEERQLLQQKLADHQADLLALTRLMSDLERQIDVSKLETKQAAHSRKENEERLHALQEKATETQMLIDEKTILLADLAQSLSQKQHEINDLEAEMLVFSDNPDQIMERLREQFVALLQEEADVSNQLTALESRLESEFQRSENQQHEVEKVRFHLQEVKKRANTQETALEKVKEIVQQLLTDYQEQIKEEQLLEAQYQEYQHQMFDVMDDVKNKKARATSLEAILKNHSHFYAGVKSVLQEAKRLGGIIGAVSEHLTFEVRYQTALEIALGASSQQIIVEDETAATRAIDFLKRTRSGRATFLPLTTIKPRELSHHSQTLEASQGFIGIASELVHFEQRLAPIFQNLLGMTAIFDTTEHARIAAQQVRYQVRIVTLDGTELRTGGAYAGGANRQNNSIFIKPELELLQREILEKEAQFRELEEKVKQLSLQRNKKKELREEIQSKGEHARLEEQRCTLAYEQTSQQLEELSTLLSLQEKELSKERAHDLAHEREELLLRLTTLATEKATIEQEIEQVKSDKDSVQKRFDQLTQDLADKRLEKAELSSQQRYEKTDLSRLEAEKAEQDQLIASLHSLLEENITPLQKVDVATLESQLAEASQEKTNVEQSIIRQRFELEDLEARTEDVMNQLENMRKQNENLIREQAKAEAEKEKISDYLHHLSSSLSEEYQMSFTQAEEAAHELSDLRTAEHHVKELEKSIHALGPINIEAIEQYDEVKKRLDFLNSQRKDVLSAKDLLLHTMTEMNMEVKERFKATFEAIRESFKVTFRQMFGGGNADLLLTDGDLLTAGVEISVQPPGKKIQSLNLMSGGEKALSALALLFSIIRVKTIPFVILDEVEAALDEANVKRFGDYLNRFDKDSQFIVVTHRKGTMAAADSIYGVTMQESGVSKIVSVKLTDLED